MVSMPTAGVVTEVLERNVHQYPRFRVALADGAAVVAVAGLNVRGAAAIVQGDHVMVELQEFNPARGRIVSFTASTS